MYAIVRNNDGTFYTSVVFGYYCKVTATDDYERYLESVHNQFYLVLDENKERLVKKYVFPKSSKYLDPRVLILDTEQEDWILDTNYQGCVGFLKEIDFDNDAFFLSIEQERKCREIDAKAEYCEYVEVRSDKDIEDFDCVTGRLHDAYIEQCEQNGDVLHVLFDGVWGCKIEVWFDGDTAFCIDSRDPVNGDPWWYGSSLIHENGYYYLIDEADMKVSDIDSSYCWFRGRRLKYRVIPNQ